MTHYGTCEKCGLEVTSASGPPAYPVTGWEVQRTDGGANQIKDRERIPNRVRHAYCLPRPGQNDRQEAMAL